MGWTSYHVSGKIDKREECRKNIGDSFPVLKDAMRGNTYYAAVKNGNPDSEHYGEVFGLVIKTSVDNKDYFNFAYKMIEDNMGPCEVDCPKAILDLLTPTDNKCANDWRERCYNNIEQKKADASFNSLPIGTKVRFIDYEGRVHILVKEPPCFQFKTWYWYDETFHGYVKKKYINIRSCKILHIPHDEPVIA